MYTMCILFVYTLLKVLSVLSMGDGFPKKMWMGLCGWGELYVTDFEFIPYYTKLCCPEWCITASPLKRIGATI